MKPEELKRRLRGVFLDELEEHVRDLERDAVSLEGSQVGPAHRELQQRLFRAAHSLKGAARSVGATEVEAACHRLEQTLEDIRQARADEYAALSSALLAHVDAIRAAGKAFEREVLPTPAPSLPPLTSTPPPPSSDAFAAATPAVAPPAPRGTDTRAVRVASDKLDVLLARVSEIDESARELSLLAPELDELARACRALSAHVPGGVRGSADPVGPRGRLRELGERIERLHERFEANTRSLSRSGDALDDEVRAVRMVPLEAVCEWFDRSVRDLAATLGKQIQLVVSDEQVEVDRSVAQRLREPLLHLVRNAVTHGIEHTRDRAAAGKPSHGSVRISARVLGAEVEVCVNDDGRGFDRGALAAEADRLGIGYEDEQDLLRMAFMPNVSTADQVTDLAGRGVGLDAVKRSVEALRGTVDLDTQAGRGSRISLRVPTALSRMRCLYIEVGTSTYALPLMHVARLVRFEPARLQMIEGYSRLPLSDGAVIAADARVVLEGEASVARGEAIMQGLLIAHQGRRVVLIVDALLDEREATIHALPRRAVQSDLLSGAISVPGGGLVPLLSVSALVSRASGAPRDARPGVAPSRRKVLVVDDSVTTRAVLRSILEDAGYAVTSAEHGAAALTLLERDTFELVVSDVQMPELDGIGLTERIRKDPRFMRLPVVLVTALAAEADRERGLHAGANAYITKSAFDHRALLGAVQKLIGAPR